MASFNPDKIRKALLRKGYFPKELPPVFTTSDFGNHAPDIMADWGAAGLYSYSRVGKRRDAFNIKLPHTEAEILSVPKKGYERRPVSIVHPIPQAMLVEELSTNWATVAKWLSRQTYSLDKLKTGEQFSRGMEAISFPVHSAKKSYIEATADWVVRSDITRFYHSIYTHSVPWGAYGKEVVKENRKAFNGSLADRLDCILRACNRNQTIGIPVGPETSRIIAEIISSRVDGIVSAELPGLRTEMVDRLQDDWFVGVQNLEFADLVIAAIIKAYRAFELDINGEKTSVDRVKTHLAEDWVQDISSFLSHRPGRLAGARLRAFLALILRLQVSHTKAAVVRYGISVLEDDKFARADIEAVESFLLKAAHVAPTAMDRIGSLLINLYKETKSLSRDRITRRLTELAQRNLLNAHTYEALWQLYAIRGLSAPFASGKIVELSANQSDSVLPLVLLDMNSRGLCTSKLPIANWENLASSDSIETDGHWLLAYEGIRHGWLKDPKNLSASRFFEPMLRRNIIFYDPRRNVRKTAVQSKVRALMKRLNRARVQRFMTVLRGVELIDDYF